MLLKSQILVRKKRQLHFRTVSVSDVSQGLFNGLEAGSYLVKKNTIDIFERLMWSLFSPVLILQAQKSQTKKFRSTGAGPTCGPPAAGGSEAQDK